MPEENIVDEIINENLPHADCPTCIEIRTKHGGFGPRHDGHHACESGSIASGGNHAHCTCDTCF